MKRLIKTGFIGTENILKIAKTLYDQTLKEKGENTTIAFPDTAYYLPLSYAFSGKEIKELRDIESVITTAQRLLAVKNNEEVEQALDMGMTALVLTEIIAAIRYLNNEEPQPGCEGFFTDNIFRSLGLQLVGGKIPGFVLIMGAAPDSDSAVQMVRDFQEKNILTFVGGKSKGGSIIDQLQEAHVEMGWENSLVPYGRDWVSAVFPINWAVRVALSFGSLEKGDRDNILKYTRQRIPATGIKLGTLSAEEIALAWGVINLGFPVLVNSIMPTLTIPGVCEYEALAGEPDIKRISDRALQIRGIKVKITKIPIPLAYSAAFHGERVRKENTYVQFGGKYSHSFEFLTSQDLEKIEDGKIIVQGSEIHDMKEGEAYPLSIWIEVAGRKMEKDFEPILERQIHNFLNYGEGIFHMGQRDMNWIRISKEAQRKGFTLHHLGVIIHARLHEEFGNIVDKVQVTISTREERVQKLHEAAQKTYHTRDERIAGLTDEGVDEFYTCTLCQSFAPHHVCIVKPERLGLCGAYNWMDCKVSHEINPKGPNQPVMKGRVIDPVLGEWEGVNKAIAEKSRKRVERFHAYSLMTYPETSCGCFECIVSLIPEVSGFLIVSRTYTDMTPVGMTFTTLAGSIGGGEQMPGFAGIGRLYLLSKKFFKADGGIKRIVWMPIELKVFLGEPFKKRCVDEGVPNLMDKIADEDSATTLEELMEFLNRVNHPVLKMEPLM
jgi:acetyl-CoA synthase